MPHLVSNTRSIAKNQKSNVAPIIGWYRSLFHKPRFRNKEWRNVFISNIMEKFSETREKEGPGNFPMRWHRCLAFPCAMHPTHLYVLLQKKKFATGKMRVERSKKATGRNRAALFLDKQSMQWRSISFLLCPENSIVSVLSVQEVLFSLLNISISSYLPS